MSNRRLKAVPGGKDVAVTAAVEAREVLEKVKPEVTVITLGGNEFEVHPISERDDPFAYDDASQFLMLAIPVGSRLFSELLKISQSNSGLIERLSKATDEDSLTGVAIDLVQIVADANVDALLRDISDTLPQLAAIACHYTDLDIRASDIKGWAKSPLNLEMWRIVIGQLRADKVFEQIGALRGLVGEFNEAA